MGWLDRKLGDPTARDERRMISIAGDQTPHGLACPRCGGMQFVPKRSVAGKMMLGPLAPKTRVKCVACGKVYIRD